jgi:DNA repair exonuclease SbcCD ATPase subunit
MTLKEEEIKGILDALAEIQARLDLLQMDKTKLLNEVKIPEEIQAIQDKIGKRKREYGQGFERLVVSLEEERAEQLAQIVVPVEIQQAFEQVQQKRQEVERKIEERKQTAYQNMLNLQKKVDEEMGEQVRQVFAEVEQRKQDILPEVGEKEESASKNAVDLTAKVKKMVKDYGATVKNDYLMAVYAKGRTTWTTDILDDIYFRLNSILEELDASLTVWGRIKLVITDLGKARKIDKPSVSIRKI